MRNTVKTSRQELHTNQIPRVTSESASELTKSTWAKLIQSDNFVPSIYEDFFATLLADGRKFPYTVLAPSFDRLIHKTTEKIICDCGDEIYVLERIGSSYEAICYPLEGIACVEIKTMLLDSHFKINGVTSQGATASSTIKFNTVSDYLFKPILENIRLASFDSVSATQRSEVEKFDYLTRINFKFMNYAKHSLMRGEKVIHAILQPEIRERVFVIFGKVFYRTLFPTHISILTDQELIMIRENEGHGRSSKYGGVWVYIPLNKIVNLSLNEKESNLLVFSIQLSGGECLAYLFQDSLRREANQLVDRFRELSKKEQYHSPSHMQGIDPLP